MLETISAFTTGTPSQYATLAAALTASSSIAFEAAIRGYQGSSLQKLLTWSSAQRDPAVDVRRPSGQLEVSLARCRDSLSESEALVRSQYHGRGYQFRPGSGGDQRRAPRPRHVILAREEDQLVGTVTLGLDSPAGLLAEEANPDAITAARSEGKRLGEVVRLAVRDPANSKTVLAALFNALHGLMVLHMLDDAYIEVNPRHVPF